MTISRKLLLGVLAPVLMALVVVVGLVVSYDTVGALQRQQSLAVRITDDTNELTDLARSYVLTHAERPRRQFLAKQQETESELAGALRGDARYREQFSRILGDVSIASSLFRRLVANHEASSSLPPAVSRGAEDRLSGQIFIRLRGATGREGALTRAISSDTVTAERRIYLLAWLFAIITATFLTVALLALRSSITRSLRQLREGTERIGSGDLGYRIGMTSRDELGDLARSFDQMSERLQGVTVSKAALEQEVRERMHAEEELRESLETTRSLLEAADSLAAWTDVHQVAQQLAELLVNVTSHKRSIVAMFSASRQELEVLGSGGERAIPIRSHAGLDRLSVVVREILADPRTRVADLGSLPEHERGVEAAPYGLQRALYVPLIQRGEVIGLATLDDLAERREFTEREIELVEGIAAQAAVAIENARLFEGEQTRRRRIESLHGVMEAGAASLEVRVSAKNMLDYLYEHETFDLMNLWLVQDDALELIAVTNLPAEYGERLSPMPLSAPFDLPKVYHTNRPVVVPDVNEGNPAVKELYESLGVALGAYVAVPLRSRAKTIGALTMAWKEPRTFTREDIDFYLSLGHELGAVVENSRLFEAERDIAERLQEALLSLPEQLEGIEFAHAYHSATEAARVGGDFYDLFELPEDHVGIVIGDVAGKGLDAAVLTSMLKNTLRAHANEPRKTPAQILGLTNDVVYKSTSTEAFVTVFFGILDCLDGRLTYANAGHTTAALIRPDGDVQGMPVTGPLLGAFEGVEFDQADARLGADELLFLYTDGLTEARRDHELYGEERLFDFLASMKDGSPAEVVDSVIRDVVEYSRDRLSDDLAILSVKRVGRQDRRGSSGAQRS